MSTTALSTAAREALRMDMETWERIIVLPCCGQRYDVPFPYGPDWMPPDHECAHRTRAEHLGLVWRSIRRQLRIRGEHPPD